MMESPRSPEISYASVVKEYSSPKEVWKKDQTQGEQEAKEIALSESLTDVHQVCLLTFYMGTDGKTEGNVIPYLSYLRTVK